MTTLTLAKLAEIEAAATSIDKLMQPYGEQWFKSGAEELNQFSATAAEHIAACDPQTILALVRIARVAALSARSPVHYWELLAKTVRDAGLLE